MDARGVHREPQGHTHAHVGREAPDTEPAHHEERDHEHARDAQPGQPHAVVVEDGHHRDGPDVVDDRERQQEQPEPVGAARAD
ncbi:hypothetical protein D3C74_446420 [compost metagenome]